jgi:hypothetical protein
MERIPLGTKYGAVVQHVAGLLAAPQLQADPSKNQSAGELAIDAGGPGPGVAEMFTSAGLRPIRVTITGGMGSNAKLGGKFNVSQHELVTTLDARLNHDRYPLTFSKHSAEGGAFKAEIADFKRNVSAAGRMQYGARQGKHDDMIFAVSLAVWWLSRPKNPPAQFSTWGG